MAARKGGSAAPQQPLLASPLPSDAPSTLATDPHPTVRVNKSHLAEIKSALDDIVKEHLVQQAFTPSHLHTTVHLALGYASVIIALGCSLYAYKMEFEESKPVLWVAVVGYFGFQGALWAWKRWVERGHHLDDAPAPAFPGARRVAGLAARFADVAHYTDTLAFLVRSRTLITATYADFRGKSLLHKARVVSGKPIGEVIDEDGGVEAGEVTRWISNLLVDAGMVGVEDEGFKDE